jgi:hypothetical protein
MLAALDALRELDFLGCREQVDPADVLQKELERICRGFGCARRGGFFLFFRRDDLDLLLLERRVELVELDYLKVEVDQREGDLLRRHRAAFAGGLHEALRLIRLEHVLHALAFHRPYYLLTPCAHDFPLPRDTLD